MAKLPARPGQLPTTPSCSGTPKIYASGRCSKTRMTTATQLSGASLRVVQAGRTTGSGTSSVKHFDYPDADPPYVENGPWERSTYEYVKQCHDASRAVLLARPDLQPPTCMQDTKKTLSIYSNALYPTMQRYGLDEIVEDNASPHNNDQIRASHDDHHIRIVGYEATEAEKEEIVRLIHQQTRHYRRDQDKKAQLTKQTKELQRLPAWPPNSPDLNLIEVVWSWMVRWIRDSDGG